MSDSKYPCRTCAKRDACTGSRSGPHRNCWTPLPSPAAPEAPHPDDIAAGMAANGSADGDVPVVGFGWGIGGVEEPFPVETGATPEPPAGPLGGRDDRAWLDRLGASIATKEGWTDGSARLLSLARRGLDPALSGAMPGVFRDARRAWSALALELPEQVHDDAGRVILAAISEGERLSAAPSGATDGDGALLERLERLRAAGSPGSWEGIEVAQVTDRESAQRYVSECLRFGGDSLYAVIAQEGGGTLDVCHTGNGPRSEAHAIYLAALHNAAPRLFSLARRGAGANADLEELRQDNKRLRAMIEHGLGPEDVDQDGAPAPAAATPVEVAPIPTLEEVRRLTTRRGPDAVISTAAAPDPGPDAHLPGIADHVAAFEAEQIDAPTPNRSTEDAK